MLESRFTGLLTGAGPVPLRAHDPDVAIYSGSAIPWGPRRTSLPVGGAGVGLEEARAAALGEAVERIEAYARPQDAFIEASAAEWPLPDEPPVLDWLLFADDQYAQPGFPFARLARETVCRWFAFREARSGLARWVPEELAFLFSERPHRLCPAISTGLACGRPGERVLLRGLEEVVERDATLGAWWGLYGLEEWPPRLDERLVRPNLRWRFFRVATPFSAHATIVTLEGEDREGFIFSVGSACRPTLAASFEKSAIEAVQGRHYVRFLRQTIREVGEPRSFPEHAVYYSLHPDELAGCAFERAARPTPEAPREDLLARIERPVLFRDLSPSFARDLDEGPRLVLRVLVPGLRPLHGDHRFAHRAGLDASVARRPHPFP